VKLDESYLARRKFLGCMLGGGAAALGAGTVVPLGQYAGDFRAAPPPAFIELAAADYALSPGTAKLLMYGRIPLLLLQTPEPDRQWRAFVAICTHLSCTVSYREDLRSIVCACHDGHFDLDGGVISGPPPAPLRPFHLEFRGERLIIALEKEDLEKAL
jgi:Rieske Fe-S protein